MEWLYDNVFAPVFDSIGETVSNLWDEHLKPLYDKIADFVGTFNRVHSIILE